MKRVSSFALLAVVLLLAVAGTLADSGRVARVIDGDTIELASGEKIRYVGIDTPETVHPEKPVEFMGKEASEFNRSLVEGKAIRYEFDVQRTDRYGRLLAYVFLDSLFVNAELVRQGFATVLTIPPNVAFADTFLALQREAIAAGRGLWNKGTLATWERQRPSAQDQGEGGDVTVYITRTGKKYHTGSCSSLRKSKIPISLKDAVERGYGPCSLCSPPRLAKGD